MDVYKLVFPPERPGLALIGLAQPIGALLPLSELQSRWAARVFSGKASLPPAEEMWRQVRRYQATCRERYYQGPRHTLQVDWIDYLDEVACLFVRFRVERVKQRGLCRLANGQASQIYPS